MAWKFNFPCALASLVILTLVQQTQQKQAQEMEVAAPRERGFRQSLTRMSPVVLQVEPCHGFAEQQLQLVKALLVGSTLGAQVALPRASSKRGDNVWDLFDMPLLLESAQSIFRNIMCERPPGAERRFWCKETPVPAILLLEADQWASLANGRDRFQLTMLNNWIFCTTAFGDPDLQCQSFLQRAQPCYIYQSLSLGSSGTFFGSYLVAWNLPKMCKEQHAALLN